MKSCGIQPAEKFPLRLFGTAGRWPMGKSSAQRILSPPENCRWGLSPEKTMSSLAKQRQVKSCGTGAGGTHHPTNHETFEHGWMGGDSVSSYLGMVLVLTPLGVQSMPQHTMPCALPGPSHCLVVAR